MSSAPMHPADDWVPTVEAPRLDYVTCTSPSGLHRMAYWEWGDPANDRILLCVHGLTRTGRDFDLLARHLSSHYRVVCPDVVGRGQSDWLADPQLYVVPQYASDMVTLLARLQPAVVDWVGTSMGGLIGLATAGMLALSQGRHGGAGQTLPAVAPLPLGRMVLNDVGPCLDWAGLGRIMTYVAQPQAFQRFEDAVAHVRSVSQGFGPHDDDGWAALTEHVYVPHDGLWVKHYDLRLSVPFAQQDAVTLEASEALLWQAYEHLPGPVLVVRGEQSDLLSDVTAQDMLARHPQAEQLVVKGVGHAPSLRDPAQIEAVAQFLLSDGPDGRLS